MLYVSVVSETPGYGSVATVGSLTMRLKVPEGGVEDAIDDLTHSFGRHDQWSRYDSEDTGSAVLHFRVTDTTKAGEQFDQLFRLAECAVGVQAA